MYFDGFRFYEGHDSIFDEELFLLPEEPGPDEDWDKLVVDDTEPYDDNDIMMMGYEL